LFCILTLAMGVAASAHAQESALEAARTLADDGVFDAP